MARMTDAQPPDGTVLASPWRKRRRVAVMVEARDIVSEMEEAVEASEDMLTDWYVKNTGQPNRLGMWKAKAKQFQRENAELRARAEKAERVEVAADSTYTHWRSRAETAERQLAELVRKDEALKRIEAIARDKSEKAWFRLETIADEAHYARAALGSGDGGWPVPEGYALVPVEPSRGRLISMAIRHNHAFLINPDPNAKWTSGVKPEHRESVLRSMRQLYEEAVGAGFYSPDQEDGYVSSFEKAQVAAPVEVAK